MLRPNGAHLFIGRKLAALGLRKGFVKRSFFLGGQLNRRFIIASQVEEETRNGVLRLGGQGADGFNGAFEQFGHVEIIPFSEGQRKQKRARLLHVISAQKSPLPVKGLGFEHKRLLQNV
jgi:hypothetical protein